MKKDKKTELIENVESKELSPPQWIRYLLSQTWNPELIISTFAIVVLLRTPLWLEKILNKIMFDFDISFFYGFMQFIIFFKLSLQILSISFIIHLILRSFWVGVVGLGSVFNDGINFSKLMYQPRFYTYLNKNVLNLKEFERKLDKISSSAFSFAFLCFFSLLSIGNYLTFYYLITGLLVETKTLQIVFFLIFVFIGFIYLIDFLSMGLIKRIKFINSVYFPIYYFLSFLTLSFIYRPLYYTFISNVKAWKLSLVISSFLMINIISFLYAFNFKEEYFNSHFGNKDEMQYEFYDNLRPTDEKIRFAAINSDLVSGKSMKLFIDWNFGRSIKSGYNSQSEFKNINFNSLYNISINDSLYSSLHFMLFEYPNEIGRGILTYIPTNQFRMGENLLKISSKNEEFNSNLVEHELNIPFYFEE